MDRNEKEDVEAALVMILRAIVACRGFLPEERRRFRTLTARIQQEVKEAEYSEPMR